MTSINPMGDRSGYKKILKQIKFEVCSTCQNECRYCAHGEMRRAFKNYQLSMEQLDRFLQHTIASNYYIENVRIHGPGEPLLWKHINDALALLKKSGVIGTIFIATNGLQLHKLKEETWNYIDEMRVSVYPNFDKHALLNQIMKTFPEKVILNDSNTFSIIDEANKREGAPIPCRCSCEGPMLIGDIIFLFCGPPVFGASEIMKKDIFQCKDIYDNIDENYLDRFDESKIGGLDLCRHCWANTNFKKIKFENTVIGSRWHTDDK
jgi:organic radical activating enzyme